LFNVFSVQIPTLFEVWTNIFSLQSEPFICFTHPTWKLTLITFGSASLKVGPEMLGDERPDWGVVRQLG
jgi:hypothetical protein